ncbi:alpha/beta hydrolase [Alkalihalophilus marmarensis]|jgi:pimeloyl-ACP methyl ester carboxylesterase|uniref:Alpha/beta hydrolase n=1 Tax=Alkalihalophilus marmarensis DSM 21297 TaxID=1188261 RepID=U6SQ64_9BACI|nr:alpha/beta hydrolase [Alkalihalophilus marmarensis]ERN53824.1 alpha/beta hydrolase [Alkalihalophilus marmarensis DSM 21297]MCM3490690.1 alpha/beta hydrolase [Alkalihalophilus marmarensis]
MGICPVSKGTIHYKEEGEGTPILILHPLGTDYRSMYLWLEPLFKRSTGFQRIYIDLPGHGKSIASHHIKTTDDMLQNILEFINMKLGNQLFSLIGCSFGGYIAQGILDHNINHVQSLCLLAPVLHLKERNLPMQKMVSDRTDESIIKQWNADVKNAYNSLITYQNNVNAQRFIDEIQPGRMLINKDVINTEWKENHYLFSKIPLTKVKRAMHNVLIIVGKQDHICGYRDQFKLMDKFQHASFMAIDKAGHMLHIEKRDFVLQMIEEWLRGIHNKD